ncbi:MAG: DNA-binding protein [Ruminococcus flavefaciens]|nr:DNA-binding protein [Ruminococcus flavefaciens]
MLDIGKIVSLEQLYGDQRELAEIVGLEAYRKLVANYGGMHVYICKSETILRELRNAEICNEFDGFNYRELAKKYNLSEKTVREIVSGKKDEQMDGQTSFF